MTEPNTPTNQAADENACDVESVDTFRVRAQAWLAANMPRRDPHAPALSLMDVGPEEGARAKELQALLYSGGFAGLCFPREYGGQGLTPEHQKAFTELSADYEMPLLFNIPTLCIIAPTILDFGTEEQKREHLSSMIRGETLWVQFMSEPSGGSDLAGAITSARRDGDVFVLNGSKIWSSYAYFSDYAVCLARTNWDAPKHRGLSMFILRIHQPGVTVEQIKQSNRGVEFCQEYFDEVPIPAVDLLGAENDGWSVASRLLVHERGATGGSSPFASGRAGSTSGHPLKGLVELIRTTDRTTDPAARQLLAETHVLDVAHRQLIRRVSTGMATGALPGPAGSLLRLSGAALSVKRTNVEFEIGGIDSVTWDAAGADEPGLGDNYVFRQASCLGGGSTEMQRNIISERVLGMPREHTADKDLPFSEVRRNTAPRQPRG